jgi:hypothetical protein
MIEIFNSIRFGDFQNHRAIEALNAEGNLPSEKKLFNYLLYLVTTLGVPPTKLNMAHHNMYYDGLRKATGEEKEVRATTFKAELLTQLMGLAQQYPNQIASLSFNGIDSNQLRTFNDRERIKSLLYSILGFIPSHLILNTLMKGDPLENPHALVPFIHFFTYLFFAEQHRRRVAHAVEEYSRQENPVSSSIMPFVLDSSYLANQGVCIDPVENKTNSSPNTPLYKGAANKILSTKSVLPKKGTGLNMTGFLESLPPNALETLLYGPFYYLLPLTQGEDAIEKCERKNGEDGAKLVGLFREMFPEKDRIAQAFLSGATGNFALPPNNLPGVVNKVAQSIDNRVVDYNLLSISCARTVLSFVPQKAPELFLESLENITTTDNSTLLKLLLMISGLKTASTVVKKQIYLAEPFNNQSDSANYNKGVENINIVVKQICIKILGILKARDPQIYYAHTPNSNGSPDQFYNDMDLEKYCQKEIDTIYFVLKWLIRECPDNVGLIDELYLSQVYTENSTNTLFPSTYFLDSVGKLRQQKGDAIEMPLIKLRKRALDYSLNTEQTVISMTSTKILIFLLRTATDKDEVIKIYNLLQVRLKLLSVSKDGLLNGKKTINPLELGQINQELLLIYEAIVEFDNKQKLNSEN